jgi:hypothetical protein
MASMKIRAFWDCAIVVYYNETTWHSIPEGSNLQGRASLTEKAAVSCIIINVCVTYNCTTKFLFLKRISAVLRAKKRS